MREVQGYLEQRGRKPDNDQLERAIEWADTLPIPIPRGTILKAIDRVGLNDRGFARTAFSYLERTQQLTDKDRKVYDLMNS